MGYHAAAVVVDTRWRRWTSITLLSIEKAIAALGGPQWPPFFHSSRPDFCAARLLSL